MPVGNGLNGLIVDALNFQFAGGALTRGDEFIVRAIQHLARKRTADPNEWVKAGRAVAEGIRYTRSIDSYIYTHRDDDKIKECAKLAIVQSILQSEQASAIWVDPATNRWRDEDKVHKSWMPTLLYLLQDKITKADNFDDLFANLTIINFNYDRCIEQFLLHSICKLYRIDETAAAEAINRWNGIIHPYGSVGLLPWQDGKRKVAFGVTDYGDILGLSDEIFTYNEQMADTNFLVDVRTAIINARRLVFFGFHFHQQNMDLLQPESAGGLLQAYATVIHRHDPEIDVIRKQISEMLPNRETHLELVSRSCREFLDHYGTSLLR
jgi:hypothetical protein